MTDPTTHPTDVSPRQARREFLKDKRGTVKDSTVRAYKYPTTSFIEFLESHDIDQMSEVGSYEIESWKDSRREEVKLVTLHNNVKHLRVFIKWCGRREYVDFALYERVDVPSLPTEDAVSEDTLRLPQAEDILRYLQKYEYASRNHAMFYTMWHTGCRISGAISLDLDDLTRNNKQQPILKFRNRREQGTPLKNGNKSERNVGISDDLKGVLRDYIQSRRSNVRDDYNRKPLFTTPTQRVSRGVAYKNFVGMSRPCVTTNNCPHDRTIEECEAAQDVEAAPSCPGSKSLHPIRRGAITYHINRGWPKDELSERVDVGVDTLNKHYDARREEEKQQGRSEHLDLL
ncbi:tyrosine-type recombinase/integrase [Halorubellus sp. PRR65]|uniref:tyrosine-type recombinase/integrase n=1 Tax=Halorubellus sp. PRR65 TaxID=3098148 RepID=UPI002B25BAB4|nr:tyrosine-type recombinase/integrase [Halorubellus sp. PRR65]